MNENPEMLFMVSELIKAYEEDLIKKNRSNPSETFVKTTVMGSILAAETVIELNEHNMEGSLYNVLNEIKDAEKQKIDLSNQKTKAIFDSGINNADNDAQFQNKGTTFYEICDGQIKQRDKFLDPGFDVNVDLKPKITPYPQKTISAKLTNGIKNKVTFNLNNYLKDLGTNDITKYDVEKCLNCKLEWKDIGFDLPSLEWSLDFSQLLKTINDAIDNIKKELDPTNAYNQLCIFIKAFGQFNLCPSQLPQIAAILPALYVKYTTDILNLKFDWLFLFGPIVKFVTNSLANLIENIPKITKPIIMCLVNGVESVKKFWNFYSNFLKTNGKQIKSYAEGLMLTGQTLINLVRGDFSAKAETIIPGISLTTEEINKREKKEDDDAYVERIKKEIMEDYGMSGDDLKNKLAAHKSVYKLVYRLTEILSASDRFIDLLAYPIEKGVDDIYKKNIGFNDKNQPIRRNRNFHSRGSQNLTAIVKAILREIMVTVDQATKTQINLIKSNKVIGERTKKYKLNKKQSMMLIEKFKKEFGFDSGFSNSIEFSALAFKNKISTSGSTIEQYFSNSIKQIEGQPNTSYYQRTNDISNVCFYFLMALSKGTDVINEYNIFIDQAAITEYNTNRLYVFIKSIISNHININRGNVPSIDTAPFWLERPNEINKNDFGGGKVLDYTRQVKNLNLVEQFFAFFYNADLPKIIDVEVPPTEEEQKIANQIDSETVGIGFEMNLSATGKTMIEVTSTGEPIVIVGTEKTLPKKENYPKSINAITSGGTILQSQLNDILNERIINPFNNEAINNKLLKKYGLEVKVTIDKAPELRDFVADYEKLIDKPVIAALDNIITALKETQSYIEDFTGAVINALKAINEAFNRKINLTLNIAGRILNLIHTIRFVLLIYKLIQKGFSDCDKVANNLAAAQTVIASVNPDLKLQNVTSEQAKNIINNLNPNASKFDGLEQKQYMLMSSQTNPNSTLINVTDCNTLSSKMRLNDDDNLNKLYEELYNAHVTT